MGSMQRRGVCNCDMPAASLDETEDFQLAARHLIGASGIIMSGYSDLCHWLSVATDYLLPNGIYVEGSLTLQAGWLSSALC